jgi:hypothetical protein
MADQERPSGATGDDRPADWDKDKMKIDFDEGDTGTPDQTSDGTPDWNKSQMARDPEDAERTRPASDEELGTSVGGLSGNSANPGGGKQWAERDEG